MCPRRYRSDRRQAATEETRRRIVRSTVELHAERGVLATSYAMIAKRADVAVPTVYNHFPTRADVLAACTGHAAAHAPPLGPRMFDGIEDVDGRLRVLIQALFAYHDYYAPWMRWAHHEAKLVPELAPLLQDATDARRGLIKLALAPLFAPPPATLLALCEILLGFSAWQRLVDEPGLEPAKAQGMLLDALGALVAQHRGKPRSKRKSQ